MNLTGKKALVTGAGRGIGKGCALALARCGAELVLNDLPDSPDLERTVEEVRALGRAATAVRADVTGRAECERLVAAALEAAGRIDILISNPAVSIRAPFLEFELDDFDAVVRGTLTSGFHMSQLVARHMVGRGGGGKIVFISSIHALVPYAQSVAYNAAKAGLNHMALTIALELAAHRINVNCIEPGWIDTPGERNYFSEEQIQRTAPTLPWGRLGTPADIGNAAAFLASDQADYITGAVLRVDGAYWLKDARENY